MKQILFFITLLVLLSNAVAQEVDFESINKDLLVEAREQPNVESCVRFLREKAPGISLIVLENKCQKLKEEAEQVQVKFLEKLRVMPNITPEKQRLILKIEERVRTKLGSLEDVKLAKLSELNEATLRKLATLKAQRLDTLTNLSKEKLNKISTLNPEKILRMTQLDEERLLKISELDEKQLEKLSALSRAQIDKLTNKSLAQITKDLSNIERFEIKLENLYQNRVIAANKYQEARNEYLNKINQYRELKQQLTQEQAVFREAVQTKKEDMAIVHAKNYLNIVTDTIINNLERLQAKVGENDDLTEEEAQEIINDLKETIKKVESHKKNVARSQTKSQVKDVGKEITEMGYEVESKIKLHTARLIKSKVQEIIRRAEMLEKRLDKTLLKLEERGYEVSKIETNIQEFSAQVDIARTEFEEARTILAQVRELTNNNSSQEQIDRLVSDARALIIKAHEDLKEAHNILKQIVREISTIDNNSIEDLDSLVEIVVEQPIGAVNCVDADDNSKDLCCVKNNIDTPHDTCKGSWYFDTEENSCKFRCGS